MAESRESRAALTGFEGYSTETLLKIVGNLTAGLDTVGMSVEAGTVQTRPKPGAATPREAGYSFVMLRDGVNAVLARRGIAVQDDRNPFDVQVEQIWQDYDTRHRDLPDGGRLVKVDTVDLETGKARVHPVKQDGSPTGGHPTHISLRRFRPTSTGYLRRADLDR